MQGQNFSNTNYPIQLLVEQIDSGELGLPDLQRPFVWKRSKIRDLFDSLYRGYPAGYFLFWATPTSVDSHGIGATHTSAPKMIVDGQQRLTSLYAVIKGKEIINEDNDVQLMRIAFNPLTEEFVVANAATDNDPEWLSNISDIWQDNAGWAFTNDFMATLSAKREVTPEEQNAVGANLDRLRNITNYQFSALELSGTLDVEVVAEIFQRINSSGVALNSADFILTLMSVYWPEGRHQLEDFARAAKVPSTGQASPYNVFHAPSPDQLLRVTVGLALKRGVLQSAYQVLRGRSTETGVVSETERDANFDQLKAAQAHVLDLTSWHEYTVAVKAAGFRGRAMLTSANNFLYGYLIYLIGKHEFGVGQLELRHAMSRWFFMSSLTGRYTGSPETILESDLRRIAEVTGANEFVELLDGIVDTQLTDDFWRVTLPDQLESSAAWSPYLFAYYAALNLLDAKALFSTLKISELLDPDVNGTRSPLERHHLFPKAYLSSIGITGTTRTNQIANYAFLEWGDNAEASDRKPDEYFPEMFGRLSAADQRDARHWHALPPAWEQMEYIDFLSDRRSRIAEVVMPTDPDRQEIPEKVINEGSIKTVAAFMNAEGGTLGIGITDDGDVTGIEADMAKGKHDLDGFENWLLTLFINTLDAAAVASCVTVRFEPVGGVTACLVDVKPSPAPVYAKTNKGDNVFYVRTGNTTRTLEGPDLVSYTTNNW